jgi:hypothetical protein
VLSSSSRLSKPHSNSNSRRTRHGIFERGGTNKGEYAVFFVLDAYYMQMNGPEKSPGNGSMITRYAST